MPSPGQPRRRSTDALTWKWLVGVLVTILLMTIGVMYGAIAAQLKEHAGAIIGLKEAWSEARTHLLYIRESVEKIEHRLDDKETQRVSIRYAE